MAFALALTLDELALHLGQLSDDVREAALQCSHRLARDVGGDTDDQP